MSSLSAAIVIKVAFDVHKMEVSSLNTINSFLRITFTRMHSRSTAIQAMPVAPGFGFDSLGKRRVSNRKSAACVAITRVSTRRSASSSFVGLCCFKQTTAGHHQRSQVLLTRRDRNRLQA
jgi:hypothetical protein